MPQLGETVAEGKVTKWFKAAGDTVKLDAFTVQADRQMSAQALAMNEQRNAPNIKNVVAIDEFGVGEKI